MKLESQPSGKGARKDEATTMTKELGTQGAVDSSNGDSQMNDREGSEVNSEIDQTVDNADTSRLLFDHHPLPMWIYDRETLTFLAVNHAAEVVYSYTRAEFLAMTLRELHSPQDETRLNSLRTTTSSAWNNSAAWRHVTKQGELLDIEIYSHDLTYQGRSACMVTAIHITQRLKTESQEQVTADQLQRYTKQLQQLAEVAVRANVTMAVPDAMQYIVDQSREIIGANQAIILLTLAQNWAQAVTAVSLSPTNTQSGAPMTGSPLVRVFTPWSAKKIDRCA